MLRCKKSIVYHWGVQFEEGKIYQISDSFEMEVEVVTEYDNYWEMTKIISKSGKFLRSGVVDSLDIDKQLPGYAEALNSSKTKKYTKEIKLPFVSIKSEDDSLHTFCSLTDKEISEKYNIYLNPDGEIPFTTTVGTISKNFDYISDIRNKQLEDLGIN